MRISGVATMTREHDKASTSSTLVTSEIDGNPAHTRMVKKYLRIAVSVRSISLEWTVFDGINTPRKRPGGGATAACGGLALCRPPRGAGAVGPACPGGFPAVTAGGVCGQRRCDDPEHPRERRDEEQRDRQREARD